jgi:predicted aconitase with swiveling domain
MKEHHRNLVALLCVLLLTNTAYSAELVMKNGRFYTGDKSQSWAEAVAIENGRYVYVGDSDGVSKFVDSDTVVHDLEGRFVLPGIVDSHTHPGLVARSVDYVDLPWTPETKQKMFDVLLAYAEENPDKGKCISNTILLLPGIRGSTAAPGALLECIHAGYGPSAIILAESDPTPLVAVLVAQHIGLEVLPVYSLRRAGDLNSFKTGRLVVIRDGRLT